VIWRRSTVSLRGSVYRRDAIGCRRFRVGVSAQGSDGVEQGAPVPDNDDAKILQVIRRQAGQEGVVNFVVAECRLVPFEAKAPQPFPEVHGCAPLAPSGG
jgi:hypothetical protein